MLSLGQIDPIGATREITSDVERFTIADCFQLQSSSHTRKLAHGIGCGVHPTRHRSSMIIFGANILDGTLGYFLKTVETIMAVRCNAKGENKVLTLLRQS